MSAGRKDDGGKPRASLIPWEVWWGRAPDTLVLALKAWQTGEGSEAKMLRQHLDSLLRSNMAKSMAKALSFGAEKYDDNNWRSVDGGVVRYRDALWRHQAADLAGEGYDRESGLISYAHRDASAAILYALLLAEEKEKEKEKEEAE